ncbi:HEAT repeat domain-containing protein [Arachidicoccus ginsenosidivorans]|uniref:HEAT repeat domain-containing protein n=1 Tax=Arachidicoccus ginsenosidivorans TaxID=496057 RepID=A0A5B8VS93_9BACT|nr:HEAT repeat domain-containing protein [Arachidicoccus ginsenosidivorans]QEC73981.1 HEAT repeat domain-containing protein [Arachidicoccus ginsenosidivorans]
MKSRKWEKKIRGIRELTNMDILIADVNILPLTNNKRQELRSEARNAYIKLSKNEPFKFFDVTTEPLLKWDQIELFKTITTTENIAIPNFARWVTYSNNKSVVAFCMELIVYYKQYDAAPAVVKLLENKDHLLRAQAINCLGKLKYEQAAPQLVHIYSNQPLNCRLEILKALGRMGNKENVTFLKQEFMYSTDFDIRKNAAKSIVRNSNKQQIDLLMESCTPENQLILKHNLNPLIKY